MSEIVMSMDERWIPLMKSGMKRCTTRTKMKCVAGDTFTLYGHRYFVTMVQSLTLRYAATHLYADEGFSSPAAMVDAIRAYYPDIGMDDRVWCHHFIAIDGRD